MPVHEVFVLLFRLSRRDEEMAHFFFCYVFAEQKASEMQAFPRLFRLSCYAAFGVWADFELSFW